MKIYKGIKIIAWVMGLTFLVYFGQAAKLQYITNANLSAELLNKEITQDEYEQRKDENSLILILLRPKDVWVTD
jgi:hypothetical protein